MVARATTSHDFVKNVSTLYIRTPAQFNENTFGGLLNHEIGTHFLRRHNEVKQIWFGRRIAYKLYNHYMETEEGLACLN